MRTRPATRPSKQIESVTLSKGDALVVRCLELFCGIGGFATACDSSSFEVVGAYDINQNALETYSQNFAHPCYAKTLESVPTQELARHDADLWWLSPACQPHTRRGRQLDLEDRRSEALLCLLDRIRDVRPSAIALENVPPFATSASADAVRSILSDCDYSFSESTLCPSELGIPNRRRRYFLIASRDTQPAWPARPHFVRTLSEYLDRAHQCDEELGDLAIDPHLLTQYERAIDIIDPADRSAVTTCFTSAYGRSHVLSGSYLKEGDRVRRFSPREILLLLGFPDAFQFSPTITRSQAYRLAGNSLSIPCVRYALSALFPIETPIV